MAQLSGKVALVTGASKGIGAAIAEALAAAGAAVAVNYSSSREGAEAVVARIEEAGGRAVAVGGDVGKPGEAKRLVSEAALAFGGPVTVLVNNAGVYKMAPLAEIAEEEYRRHFDTNVWGLLAASQAVAAQIDGQAGSIINISSVVARGTFPGTAVYAGTKGAVNTISGVLAKELGPQGIRVNSLSPGLVATEGTRTAGIIGSEMEQGVVATTPLGRVGQPDDIAAVAVFLASAEARWVTGQIIEASGGA
ncbi:glucose 1-dehydrogenase (plasmid) [Lichenicola cladoniae]|uniref:Glucose 1-dehydrogenase n=1 Tax=Lichenicola cladoniae TaxID=1484109 RepID=A0A6M8HXZ6_9PROT|nr:glucose 1-dehydrogenase [Lichenicola cladoniae]NPD70049.1 glucose 1-dehydrogenase [Acetobacteraceae bacterium]QKE93403.1 glucose 1-dehydrogenase [Lichenicola cladoniae]